MLSYQHAYHAGNLADVHKHAVLALVLAYMAQKTKPISYLETHAGRGLYDLSSKEALKTGEATSGVGAILNQFAPEHPYRRVVERVRAEHGPDAYPGSPLFAADMAQDIDRTGDRLQLAELHPKEHEALVDVMPRSGVHIYKEDGFPWAARLCPPTPRRGLMMIDPSYELAHDYTGIAGFIDGLHGLWPVGVIMLWYPILDSGEHEEMADAIMAARYKDALFHEVIFKKAAMHHRLKGSGMIVINAPYTLGQQLAELDRIFRNNS